MAKHAHEMDTELPLRRAGSQEEFAAAAYIVAHLQDAGYVTRLDAVPVGDLVRSTNVRTTPGSPARILVAVLYDNAATAPATGADIGLFLELARAAALRGDQEEIVFAALGAEHSPQSGSHLGSRRLAQLLSDAGDAPRIAVLLSGIAPGAPVFATGTPPDALQDLLTRPGAKPVHGTSAQSVAADAARVLGRVADHHVMIGGDPIEVARILLAYFGS